MYFPVISKVTIYAFVLTHVADDGFIRKRGSIGLMPLPNVHSLTVLSKIMGWLEIGRWLSIVSLQLHWFLEFRYRMVNIEHVAPLVYYELV